MRRVSATLIACYLIASIFTITAWAQFNYVSVYHSAWGDPRGIDNDWFERNGSFMTHIIHFKIDPTTTPGVWGYSGGQYNHDRNRAQIIANAHARGIKVLLCLGGDNGRQFLAAAQDSALLENIITSICNFARTSGYDGIDLDYESDVTAFAYERWSRFLRRRLDTWPTRGTLTCAAGRTPGAVPMWVYNTYYDHLNIMLYDGNGWWSCAWGQPAGISGFHEPLNDPSANYPTICDGATINTVYCLGQWESGGVNKAKAAPSTAFYGYSWAPTVNAPGQRQTGCSQNCSGITNGYEILNNVASGAWTRHYDNVAQQPWANTANQYVNYQDAQSIAARLDYFKRNGWGGVFFFANEHAVDPNKPAGSAEKFVFYDAVKNALNPPTVSAPSFVTQPINRSAVVGATATFSVQAAGYPVPTLQWQKNGVNIAGATSFVYTTPVTVLGDNGASFRCVATNSQGTTTSNAAVLTVTTPTPSTPSFSVHPSNSSVSVGATATFNVTAEGFPAPTLQWQKNGSDISGATSASYTTPATVASDNGATFRCIATNAQGSAASNSALLTVNAPIVASPRSDDFSNPGRFATTWTLSHPSITTVIGQNTADALLRMNLDATPHDLWTGNFGAVRVLQDITNGSFEVVAKFQSMPSAAYQMQGIVVKENATSWLRFDILRDNAGLKFFAGTVTSTAGTAKINNLISISGSQVWIKVNRSEDTWTAYYSTDNSTFTQAGQFTHSMIVDSIGVFAGNQSAGSGVPAFDCKVDYFFNTSSPISPEDPVNLPTGSLTSDRDSLPSGGGDVVLSWTSTGATSASLDQGIGSIGLSGSRTVTLGQSTTFTLTLTNANGSQTYSKSVVVRLPSGGGNPNDITAGGTPVAFISNPTGVGNKNIEIIRDGITPPAGGTNVNDQYDTYNGGGARATDWIGYTFAEVRTFGSVLFQEGMNVSTGGFFAASPIIEIRVGGQWIPAQGLTCSPAYGGASAPSFSQYSLRFYSIVGDGIRIKGVPGGTAKYISLAELRVYSNQSNAVPPEEKPKDYFLLSNYPNPFNPSTTIRFSVPTTSQVNLAIFDVLGKKVRTLVDRVMDQGTHPVTWDGKDDNGESLSSGVYMYRMRSANFVETRKMILTK